MESSFEGTAVLVVLHVDVFEKLLDVIGIQVQDLTQAIEAHKQCAVVSAETPTVPRAHPPDNLVLALPAAFAAAAATATGIVAGAGAAAVGRRWRWHWEAQGGVRSWRRWRRRRREKRRCWWW